MACSITITSVIGTGGSPPTGIVVKGTAAGCASGSVVVEVTCGGAPLSLTVPVSPSGDWSTVFSSGGQCVCTKLILVIVSCKGDPNCVARLETPLRCEGTSPPCNSTGDLTVTVDGCVGGAGNATAAFIFTVTPPLAGCSYLWLFGDGSPTVTTQVPSVTHVYFNAGTFTVIVVATCPSADGDPCVVRDVVTVTIPACGGCPTVNNLTATVSGCAAPGLATVTFNGTLVPPLAGCSFLWAFGDNTTLFTAVPSASHIYAAPATYAVAVTAICPGINPCATTTIAVVVPRCCPVLTGIQSNLENSDCANGAGISATVNFSAVTDPSPAAGTYTWNFGDGSPLATNPGQNASHNYASPGTYTVQVTYTPNAATYPGCASSSLSVAGVTVPACSGGMPPPPPPPDNGGGWSCFALRVIMTIAAILSIVALSIAICLPAAAYPLFWLAAGLGLIAALAGLFWGIFCPKPCAWALLLAWQVSLGVGFVLLCFSTCCPTFWVLGIGLVLAGIGLMYWWKRRCRKSWCAVLKELVIALSGVVLPLLGWLGAIPGLAACINPLITGALSTLAAAIAVTATNCDS